MPLSDITLKAGVNVEATATALRAGYVFTQLGRFRAGFFEKVGGWTRFYFAALGGVPRALLAWLDLNASPWLGIGSTTNLSVINQGVLTQITPQTFTSDFTPNIQTSNTSTAVTVNDANLSQQATTFDVVEFKTPVSVDGLILAGSYPITTAGTGYVITAATAATGTRSNATITAITNANPAVVTAANNFANSDYVYISAVAGMTQVNGRIFQISAVSGTGFTLTGIDSTGFGVYSSGGVASPAKVPQFTPTSGSALVSVLLQGHGLVTGNTINFPIATTVGGVTNGVFGNYTITRTDANNFTISMSVAATNSTVVLMNGGNIEIVYYIGLGPVSAGQGYGVGFYGTGNYGVGSGSGSGVLTGSPLVSTDWSLDNWNDRLMACPVSGSVGGAIYTWQPNSGFTNAQMIATAPIHNNGIFVAAPRLALVAYGSTVTKTIGLSQDPLIYNISDLGDYTYWTPNTTNPNTGAVSQAYQNRIPTGSRIITGLAAPNQILMWTDLDLWSVTYQNLPTIWTQAKIGSNCGAVSRHATAQMSGVIYWMGKRNFYALAGGAPISMPCPVWDAVFQNLDNNNLDKCWAQAVTSFNEIWFFYPSVNGGGQCDSYVKVNVLDGSWDLSLLPRSIGIDQSVLGNPIMGGTNGVLYQHETGQDADGQPLIPIMKTGFFYLDTGQNFCTVDQFWPDFKYNLYDGLATSATIQITFFVSDAFNAPIRTYGPYNMTTATQKLDVRFRGRVCAFNITSTDIGSFWRLGQPKFRLNVTGRR